MTDEDPRFPVTKGLIVQKISSLLEDVEVLTMIKQTYVLTAMFGNLVKELGLKMVKSEVDIAPGSPSRSVLPDTLKDEDGVPAKEDSRTMEIWGSDLKYTSPPTFYWSMAEL